MRHPRTIWIWLPTILALLGGAALGSAQTFSSGSTGVDGVFNPPASVPPGTGVNGSTYTVPLPANGVFNFTTITIASGVTVKFARNATNTPVTLLASGDVNITGTIDVSGSAGGAALVNTTATYSLGGLGGPGGYDGGTGATTVVGNGSGNGQGPGGGKGPTSFVNGCNGGGGGYASAGGTGYRCTPGDGIGGPSYGSAALLPLLGGSGGGGGGGGIFGTTGAGGGGGGGALLIASSSTLTLTGSLKANGGAGGIGNSSSTNVAPGGGGSGGAIRLIATTMAGAGGTVLVNGGAGANGYNNGYPSGPGAAGRIRIEAFTSTAAWSFSLAPSQTLPGSVQLSTTPTLTLTSAAGVAAPATPQGLYARPDITLPVATTSPVTVALAASNIPLGTTVTITATPMNGSATTATSTGLSGSVASSTATASVAIPLNQPVVLTASATFTLLADAGGGPTYANGEAVTHVRVAATLGGPSSVTYLTRSGREIVVR